MLYLSNKFDQALSWFYIWRIWGSRCSDFEPTCHTCQQWAKHNDMFNVEYDPEHTAEMLAYLDERRPSDDISITSLLHNQTSTKVDKK